jgi:anti-anti-sigma regulatory factor
MTSAFKILHQRDGDCLNLKLRGDIDGAAACEIITFLEDHCKGVREVCIDTSGLTAVSRFGREVFSNNFHKIKNQYAGIVFTGDGSNRIAPAENQSL